MCFADNPLRASVRETVATVEPYLALFKRLILWAVGGYGDDVSDHRISSVLVLARARLAMRCDDANKKEKIGKEKSVNVTAW